MDELKLIMEKGPLAGQTLIYTTRSVIRIGRVVRGNTIAIKDSGISSKHLSIHFDSTAAHWTIQDLDSSNGTILNGVHLVPFQPAPIKGGDTIKIGEFTSILVRIEIGEASQVRRNPRRQARGGKSNLSECGGGSELGLGLECGEDLGDNVVEVEPVKRNLRGRGRRGAGSKKDTESVVEVEEGNEMNVRKTKSSKKKGQVVEFNPTLPTVPESLAENRKNLGGDSMENVGSGGLDEVSGKKGCFDLKKMEAIDERLVNRSIEAVGMDAREELRVPNGLNSEGEGLKKDDDVCKGVDMEKMTLGEWFDYLEQFLPKQIYDETEAMILKMKQEAAKLHEFRLQQENAND